MAFLRTPGIELLYSGETITNGSFDSRRRCSSIAPGAMPFFDCVSWLYEGQSKSVMAAESTVPPCSSIRRTTRRARRVLSESARRDAENTRK
jgi:hypothetical protein